MGIGVSVFLLAVGAILAFAVSDTAIGEDVISIDAVGIILMVAGLIGLALTLLVFNRDRDSGTRRVVEDRTITRDDRDVY